MGRVTIVRHGQASLGGDDYDRLSDTGRLQSRRLGEWMAADGRRFDRVLTGPLRRHLETHEEAAAAAADAGSSWPAPEQLAGLTEHQAIAMIDQVLGNGQRTRSNAPVASEEERREQLKRWFVEFDRTMRGWIRREIEVPDLESWQEARQRAARTLDEIIDGSRHGDEILVISSGGFLSMALGALWKLDDETVYELSLEVNNSAWAEIRFSPRGRRVRCFNWHPHLSAPDLVTLV